jgi:AcrR family transcriptional regulator
LTGIRERKKQRRHDEIVDASIALFRERGFDETRVEDILESCDISLGTFYNYFPGKDAVLDEFGASVIAEYIGLAQRELAASELSVAERVRALASASGRAFSADPEFMTVVVTRSRAFGGRGELPARDVPIYAILAHLFEEGQASGEIRDDIPPVELAESFSGSFMFTVISWLSARETDRDSDLDARLGRALDIFLDGARRAPSR